jgi:transcriptional regulator with XRE-family HTH domain
MQLKIARLRARISQKDLARIIGVKHQPLVSHWETGRFMPTEQYLKKLNIFLGMNPLAVRLFKQIGGHLTGEGKG